MGNKEPVLSSMCKTLFVLLPVLASASLSKTVAEFTSARELQVRDIGDILFLCCQVKLPWFYMTPTYHSWSFVNLFLKIINKDILICFYVSIPWNWVQNLYTFRRGDVIGEPRAQGVETGSREMVLGSMCKTVFVFLPVLASASLSKTVSGFAYACELHVWDIDEHALYSPCLVFRDSLLRWEF